MPNRRLRLRKLQRHVAYAALIVGAGLIAAPSRSWAADATDQAAAEATGPESTSVTEVIVTATRREEALSRVPIAVSAASGQQIKDAHITNFADLPAMAAGITFSAGKGQSTGSIIIRGQTQSDDSTGLEVPVAVFVDDIYYGTLADFDGDFYDIQQIAVLKGPQGTTFGRNVVGGALQITTNKPQLGVTDGEIDVTAETFAGAGVPASPGFTAQGFFNLPISQDAALRLAYDVKDVDGYMHNFVTGHDLSDQKSFAIRPSLLWQPNDHLRVSAFVSWDHENEYASGYHAFGQGALVASDTAISSSPWASFQDVDGTNKRDAVAAQFRVDLEEAYGTLTAITSYRWLNANYVDDGDSSPLPVNNNSINASKESEFSEELRLTSPSGRKFEYVAGLYYGYENLQKFITFGFNGTIPTQYLSVLTHGLLDNATIGQDDHTQTLAPFAEGRYHFTDELALTVGARYTYEFKDGFTQHVGFSPFFGNPYLVNWQHGWGAFTPRVILEYTPSHTLLFYGSVSTGFKGGGYSYTPTTAAAAIIPLKPENSTSYEIGAKVKLFDDRLAINADGYWVDTKDLQVRSLEGAVYTETNAALERVRGVELESTLRPFQGAQIGLNYTYTNAVYQSFPGCTATGINCSGNMVPGIPANDVKVLAQYRWQLPNEASLTVHVDDEWASKMQVNSVTSADQFGVIHTAKNGFLNASLAYRPANAPWDIQLWGKNLTNQWQMASPGNYYFYFLSPAEFNAGLRFVERGTITPPLQVGVTLNYRF